MSQAPTDVPADAVKLEVADGVATLTLDRPQARNALAPEHFAELGRRLEEVAASREIRVLVLTGAGDAFCAGADLTGSPETLATLADGPLARTRFARDACAPAGLLHRLPQPTLAAVNGVAAGGGCNLALGCDLVFAGASARFAEIFVNRGLALDYGGTWLLPRLVGLQRAKHLAFRGDVIGAEEARELGLVLEVVPDAELAGHVAACARELAARPPIALARIKSGLNRALGWSFEEALAHEAESQGVCLGTEDFREAMAAWVHKRPGNYTGK